MAINWFPGHMHKARKEIRQVMPQMDLIIEVVDARIPFSSENPLVPALRGDKPLIKVLNKRDLADPDLTRRWQRTMEQERGVRTLALRHDQPEEVRQLLGLASELTPNHDRQLSALRIMILGIPNVGKSTLINTLAGRMAAKTGNEPAVTRAQQAIKLPDNCLLYDTPGFLWPKLSPESSGYRLAVTGAIRSAVIDYEEVGLFAAETLLELYPEALVSRYNLEEKPADGLAALDAIALSRNFRGRGGIPNLFKASEVLLNELRSGKLGPLTLETPEQVAKEVAEQIHKDQAEAEEKSARKQARQSKRKR